MSKECSLCSTKLNFLNTPTFGFGKLKDGGQICHKCFTKMLKTFGANFRGNNYTLTELQQGQVVANEQTAQIQADSEQIKSLIEGKQSFTVDYLGGLPNIGKGSVQICAIGEGIILYNKKGFGSNACFVKISLIPWTLIARIDHTAETTGNSASKTALTTAGLIKRNNLMLAAGLVSSGPKTTHFLAITMRDATGFESDVVFLTDKARDIALYLSGQRQVLFEGR